MNWLISHQDALCMHLSLTSFLSQTYHSFICPSPSCAGLDTPISCSPQFFLNFVFSLFFLRGGGVEISLFQFKTIIL